MALKALYAEEVAVDALCRASLGPGEGKYLRLSGQVRLPRYPGSKKEKE